MWSDDDREKGGLPLSLPYDRMRHIADTLRLVQAALNPTTLVISDDEERARCKALDLIRLFTTPSLFTISALSDQCRDHMAWLNSDKNKTGYYNFLYQSALWVCVSIFYFAAIPRVAVLGKRFTADDELRSLVTKADIIYPVIECLPTEKRFPDFTSKRFEWIWPYLFRCEWMRQAWNAKEIYIDHAWYLFTALMRVPIIRSDVFFRLAAALKYQLECIDSPAFKRRCECYNFQLQLAQYLILLKPYEDKTAPQSRASTPERPRSTTRAPEWHTPSLMLYMSSSSSVTLVPAAATAVDSHSAGEFSTFALHMETSPIPPLHPGQPGSISAIASPALRSSPTMMHSGSMTARDGNLSRSSSSESLTMMPLPTQMSAEEAKIYGLPQNRDSGLGPEIMF